jgi:hypothetical protein
VISKRAIVVTDDLGVLEVFGPYSPEEISGDLAALEDLDNVEVSDVELRYPEAVAGWIDDPEGFYGLGEDV